MSAQRIFFANRVRQTRTIHGYAAGKNKLRHNSIATVRLCDGFHHPRGSRYIDVPHAIKIEHSGAHRVQHKRQMNHRRGAGFTQQQKQLATGFLLPQIHLHEAQGKIGLGVLYVHPNDFEFRQLRQKT